MILILPPPIGYVHLYQAVETVGRAACGARWVSVHCQDELKGAMMAPSAALQDVIMSIAEACEAGKLAAAYPNALGGRRRRSRSRRVAQVETTRGDLFCERGSHPLLAV